jgi:ubiquinone/menaquinone biosynthesis C-methylase UbiE
MDYDGYIEYNKHVANSYDVDRQEEIHWMLENSYIQTLYKNLHISTLLDLPVGTGRFMQYYENVKNIVGIDISEDMLNIAKKKALQLPYKILLQKGDAFHLTYPNDFFLHTVCFRLMHLIPPDARQMFINELTRVTRDKVILQVYMENKLPLYKKIISKFQCLLNRSDKNPKPWSHINAYKLSEFDFNILVRVANLKIAKKTLLCNYQGENVYVYELSKIND